ncbi:phage head closure protein [Rhizobium sp. VS19-DR104.2]|uniref:phage head closure protein n=1 Tax=unclassified Rhizobium TaxID=2613769 RepID=UPI001CC3E2CA|nr:MULTISPECIES: phage head closure protein [unclassified Rhizobium]MBZ5760276.1 phage head closure protein [Rhizobium sp. VS19-DR96]MBZ5766880.1 phage head closure protein [Rhizobium sp. VS19-DR129.2]MBZ5773127.1 phage head closure protein [Rhizobium sp. VS19-DRK62.2]MBZ5784111.1 phage head closure protein [Rhizobium sp. VS19-DR121]MBZ5802471.1 phage head closure protein [Rhizobium sp. VS19-DR181]
MARTRSAGDLYYRVAFDSRVEADDGAGNTVGDWEEQFQSRAGFTPLRGGEAIMAGRLQGQQTKIIFIRSSIASRQVTLEWRVRDMRTGETYNIREITPTEDRMWIDLLCQSGVAAG